MIYDWQGYMYMYAKKTTLENAIPNINMANILAVPSMVFLMLSVLFAYFIVLDSVVLRLSRTG